MGIRRPEDVLRRHVGLAFTLGLLAVAGCIGEDLDTLGDATTMLVVSVTEETPGGPPLEGATVEVWVKDCGGGLLCFSWDPLVLGTAVTDADGTAEVPLPEVAGRLHVHVRDVPGHTNEVVRDVEAPAVGETAEVTVVTYRDALPVAVNATLPPGAMLDDWEGLLFPPSFYTGWGFWPILHDDPDVHVAYVQRLVGLDIALQWDNGPGAHGDLWAGVFTPPLQAEWTAAHGEDHFQTPLDTGNVETVTHEDQPRLTYFGDRLAGTVEEEVALVVFAHRPVVTVLDLPLTFTGEARFQGIPAELPSGR